MHDSAYFIADIAANHDGSLDRALSLISAAKDAGADCAKFQHFRAGRIVSATGFDQVGRLAHQRDWPESVVDAYVAASVPWEWTSQLAAHCREVGIDFMSTPYDVEALAHLLPYVSGIKIGSGDIDYQSLLGAAATSGKRIYLATGASSLFDVRRAVSMLTRCDLVLMQCNTNYTGSLDNFDHLNLRALQALRLLAPVGTTMGLSDHTRGHVAVLGAVALGARVIEKHFTDSRARTGPDHAFSLTPTMWRWMVDDTDRLLRALGDGVKRVEENEREAQVVQRRSVYTTRALRKGEYITAADVISLRPAIPGAFTAWDEWARVGFTAARDIPAGAPLTWRDA
jgi:sialic acid synthase SpsE